MIQVPMVTSSTGSATGTSATACGRDQEAGSGGRSSSLLSELDMTAAAGLQMHVPLLATTRVDVRRVWIGRVRAS